MTGTPEIPKVGMILINTVGNGRERYKITKVVEMDHGYLVDYMYLDSGSVIEGMGWTRILDDGDILDEAHEVELILKSYDNDEED
jgi:hypothetical protein